MLQMAGKKNHAKLRIMDYPAHARGHYPAHAGGLICHSAPEQDYIIKHCARRFIFAADSLNLFDPSLPFKEVAKFLPDQTGQTECFEAFTLEHIREEMGLYPFLLSCHLCFAQMFDDTQRRAFLDLPYSELYADIAEWEKAVAAGEVEEDSFPPKFHSLMGIALKLPDLKKVVVV